MQVPHTGMSALARFRMASPRPNLSINLPTVVDSPYEGDSVLSPSARLVVSRLAGADGQGLGYVLRRVRATRFGQTYQVDIDQQLATICMPGAKANISFDERFLVTHHYHDGKSDILLYDLATGSEHQIRCGWRRQRS